MISVEEALERVTGNLTPVGTETVSIDAAHGRVLAETVTATLCHPPAPVSAMDGYAIRVTDVSATPVTLDIVGESRAGVRYSGDLGPGQAVRIFTGAVVPEGADGIVIQENTEAGSGTVTINQPVESGTFIRPKGLDIAEGDVLAEAGMRLSARDAALIASNNTAHVMVYRKPVVAILATGDELVMPGEPLGPDQIVSSNSIALAGYVRAFGGEPKVLGIARDTRDSLGEMLSRIGDADMLITIGGASVGDYDLVADELGARGLELEFQRVAMRPGKPVIFGRFGSIPMLGLPGNPVSVGATSCLFVAPAIGILAGLGFARPEMSRARVNGDLGKNDRREEYLRARLSQNDAGEPVATPFNRQDSAMFAAFAHADCLIKRAPNAPAISIGDWVEVVHFPMGPLRF